MPQSAKNFPTQEYLNECFRYDPKTGYLFWKFRPLNHFNSFKGMNISNGMYFDTRAGALKKTGYITVGINAKRYYAHRIIWVLNYGSWPLNQIDHINHNRSDNRIENICLATNKQNGWNQSIHSTNTSGTNGVSWSNSLGKWVARIMVSGKPIYLGGFKIKFDAINARSEADIKYKFHQNHGGSK
jgi:hypothetical protein